MGFHVTTIDIVVSIWCSKGVDPFIAAYHLPIETVVIEKGIPIEKRMPLDSARKCAFRNVNANLNKGEMPMIF